MGSDHSHLSGIDIEDKAVEVADFWSQHTANLPSSKQLSASTVFIGELFVSGPLWTIHTPLEKCSKNLMIYRHPCILRYISSWSKSSKFYLAVEHVKPLSHVFSSLNVLQLCIGLHSILKALCFLHEKGSASHNNVCLASIYVADDGNWKLGGMEFTCKYNELSKDFLSKSKANRYSTAIDVNEEDHIQKDDIKKEFIDTYAFFILVTELLKPESGEVVPSLEDFRILCKQGLENINVYERPKLSDLMNHAFFKHEFIVIHAFLTELPLKSDEEKSVFFSSLTSNLRKFDELLVASQLSGHLLSRMVLLNSTAQQELLPNIFSFKQNGATDNCDTLFSENVFKEYIVPRLLEIFSVRDAQVRLLLLTHFKNYMNAFSQEELQSYILPELLVGIKDTNDILVSATLQALSILVLVLGAGTVIGGKRAKLFTDGRPTLPIVRKSRSASRHITSLNVIPTNISLPSNHDLPESQLDLTAIDNLPERQRPDGEEVETLTDEVDMVVDEELEWEDWEINENSSQHVEEIDPPQIPDIDVESTVNLNSINLKHMKLSSKTSYSVKKKDIQDIDELDIKNQRNSALGDDIDFFQDMEPEIESSAKYLIRSDSKEQKTENLNKLGIAATECDNEDGWGEEDWG